MKNITALLGFILLTFALNAQNKPDDFLSSAFHKERRALVREKMPANSVAVLFANPVRNRSNDVDYVYHQDPNFYYLTGYTEPHAVLLIFKEPQETPEGNTDEIIFVQPRNEMAEMWTGRRLGTAGVSEQLALNTVFNNTEFADYNIDFTKFDKVLFYDFFNDVRDTNNKADLYDLIAAFKQKVNYPSQADLELEPKANNLDMETLDQIMKDLRGIKTKEEIDLLRKAVDISCIAQREVMKAMRPGMSEREVQGIHEFIFKKYQAEYEGYPSIVGAGHNGCILHYIDNYKPEIESDEMILMDLGAEYHGYTADVTRTIPVDGKFSKEEKAIYDLVYKAQQAAIEACKPGMNIARDLDMAIARRIINEGLVELGIIDSVSQKHLYYPHGLGHHIGLDVHDKGNYEYLEPNMAITIEPGIYIPKGAPCAKKWWGIAVRIEDDILITEDGYELLSDKAPRKSDEIEALMKEPSPLDAFILPSLGEE
ncbi:aminopeptidase P N-terminal domain-containing protein [Marinoscillum furvescens]|uniref:Xaa-Pro aminopeptidase n=1 Tax=Marinoscillum furvescens DSM 4134 TaxID=1122208 RepID=A0A3D9L8D3_MARFU|nr:aminopeptidase P N-terminal domain-containing protein [Marinoscillum furvescens]REE01763.1 Xaa-Pro aminopeptidase [Marinoscillum furvescens DSM 4134]